MVLSVLLALPLAFAQGQEGVPEFQSVHIVFAEEHASSLISSFGHIFVCLPEREVRSTSDLLGSTALNFGANLGPLGKGAWVGEYKLRPFHELARKNVRVEQRRLTFFELSLSTSELSQLREDLQGRLEESYSYDFLRHNCGHYILDWLKGPDRDRPSILYQTPREALAEILLLHPPVRIRQLRSDVDILEEYLRDCPAEVYSAVVSALDQSEKMYDLEDLVLRLLAVKVSESNAGQEEYAALQQVRISTLQSPTGLQVANELVSLQQDAWNQELAAWTEEPEGPSLAVGYFSNLDTGGAGTRFQIEAGLRDFSSSPASKQVLREVQFLAATIDLGAESTGADFTLASISTHRDITRLMKAPSNGASLGYAGLANQLGTKGLYAATWGGVSMKAGSSWFGGRVTVAADDLQDRGRLIVAPGFTFEHRLGPSVTSVEVHYSLRDGEGWFLNQDLILSDATSIQASILKSPLGENLLALTLQVRF